MKSRALEIIIIAVLLQSAEAIAVDTVYTADVRSLPAFETESDRISYGEAITINKVFMAVGAPTWGALDSGAIFAQRLQPFVPNASLNAVELPANTFRRITPSRQVEQEKFGSAVAADNAILVVGAPCRRLPPPRPDGCSGAAYVFDLARDITKERQLLLPDDLDAVEEFGASVAISGSWLAIGAPGGDGRVFLYRRETSGWVLTQILYSRTGRGGRFGHSIALRRNTLVVGAPQKRNFAGEVEMFELSSSSNWISTPSVYIGSGDRAELFGQSVALSENGNTMVAGAPFPSIINNNRGFVAVYRRVSGSWVFSAKLTASDCDRNCVNNFGDSDEFGRSVSISNDTILVGASKARSFADRVPSSFIFRESRNQTQKFGSQWVAIPFLDVGVPFTSGKVAVSGNRAVVSVANCGLRFRGDNCVYSATLENRFLSFPLSGQTPYSATINSVLDHSVPYSGFAGRYYSNDTNAEIVAFSGERGVKNCGRPLDCQLSSDDPSYRRHVDDSGGRFIVNSNYSGAGFPEHLSYDGHPGYDYKAAMGTAIYAPADGIAYIPYEDPVTSESDPLGAPKKFSALAIDHRNGYTSWFLHLGDRSTVGDSGDFRRIKCGFAPEIAVKQGDFVTIKAGCRIGFVGDKGLPSSAPHLHYEVRVGASVDVIAKVSECRFGLCRPVDPYGWDPLLVAPRQRDPDFYFPNLVLWKK